MINERCLSPKHGNCIMLSSIRPAYGIVALFLLTTAGLAFGEDSKVVIVNGTASHCLPYLSCYRPYEVDVSPGSTVTWVNDDNRTHTATAGTPNGGPVGAFDSGPIPPGKSYTQFFGALGRFTYYDKTDMWPSGIVVVSNQGPTNAEIGWVNGTLALSSQGTDQDQKLTVTKEIQNTGGTDASSVLFRLRILNGSGFLFYDSLLNGTVPARQNANVSFTWNSPQPGIYRLNFDAVIPAMQSDENTEVSSDLISIAKTNSSQLRPIVTSNYVITPGNVSVPEFGPVSYAVLFVSIISVTLVTRWKNLGW